MIQKSKSYTTTDGNVYSTLEIAQRAELLTMITPADHSDSELTFINIILDTMFGRLDDVKAILCATGRKPRSKKAIRKDWRKTAKQDKPIVVDLEKASGK